MGGDGITIINATKKIAFDCDDWMDSVPSFQQINKMAHLMKWDTTDKVYGLCSSCYKKRKPCNDDVGIVCNNNNKVYEEYDETDLKDKFIEIVDSIEKTITVSKDFSTYNEDKIEERSKKYRKYEVDNYVREIVKISKEYYQQCGEHYPNWIDGKCSNCQ